MESVAIPRLVPRRRPRSPIAGSSSSAATEPLTLNTIRAAVTTVETRPSTSSAEPTPEPPTHATIGPPIVIQQPEEQAPIVTPSQPEPTLSPSQAPDNSTTGDGSSIPVETILEDQNSSQGEEQVQTLVSPLEESLLGQEETSHTSIQTPDEPADVDNPVEEALVPLANGMQFRIRHKPLSGENTIPLRLESVDIIQNDRKRSFNPDGEEIDREVEPPRKMARRVRWADQQDQHLEDHFMPPSSFMPMHQVLSPAIPQIPGALYFSARLTIWKYCQREGLPDHQITALVDGVKGEELVKLATAIQIFQTQDYNHDVDPIANAGVLLKSLLEVLPSHYHSDYAELHAFLKRVRERPDNGLFALLSRYRTQAELTERLDNLKTAASPQKLVLAMVAHLAAGILKSMFPKTEDLSTYKEL